MEILEQIDILMQNLIANPKSDLVLKMFKKISPGKKLRSKLILNIAEINEKSLNLCAIIELIHCASLLHDDVIDESDTRRGNPSINAIFGAKSAIMLGDALYSKGFFELCKFDNFIASCVSDAVAKLSIGELMDVNLSQNFSANLDAYKDMIYLKTAVLIEACGKAAAKLTGADDEICVKFGEYGKNLGIAFQIIDDILDITQNSISLGKPAMNDYKEGKTTLPYIYLYRVLDKADKEKLKSFYKKSLNHDEILWIRTKFDEYNIIARAKNEAKDYGTKALQSIKDFKNEKLENIVKTMIYRDF